MMTMQTVTAAVFERKCRDGEWEAMRDVSSQGMVEVRVGNKRRTVRVKMENR